MLPASYSYQKLQFTASVRFLPWQRSQRSCDIGRAICSQGRWAKKPQNPQNHWVARLHNIAFPQILVSLAPLRFYSSIVSLAGDFSGWALSPFLGGRGLWRKSRCVSNNLVAFVNYLTFGTGGWSGKAGCNCVFFFRFPGTQCMALFIYLHSPPTTTQMDSEGSHTFSIWGKLMFSLKKSILLILGGQALMFLFSENWSSW